MVQEEPKNLLRSKVLRTREAWANGAHDEDRCFIEKIPSDLQRTWVKWFLNNFQYDWLFARLGKSYMFSEMNIQLNHV